MKFIPLTEISDVSGGDQTKGLPSRAEWEDINPGGDYDAAMKGRAQAPAMEVQPSVAPTGLKFVPLEVAPEAPVAQAQAPAPTSGGFLDALGTGMNAVRDWATGAAKPRGSVLETTGRPVGASLATEDKMLQPQFVQAVEAKLNSLPEDKRAATLEKMLKRPDAYGRAAKVVAGRYAGLEQVTSPTLQKFDPRLEAQTARFVEQGLRPDIAEGLAKQQAQVGELRADFDQMTEAAPEYAEAAPYRVQGNLTGIAEAGQTLLRGGVKAGLAYEQGARGVNRFIGDTLGFDTSTNRARLNSIDRFTKAMGEQSSKPLNLIEGAITSIGQQAPALLGGALTGSTPAVLTAMFAQSFGQTYDDGARRGLDYADNVTRSGMYAALEILGERFGLGDAIKGIKAAAKGMPSDKIAGFFAKSLVKQVPGEELTYAGQFAVDKGYGMNPEAGIADFISGAADTLAATMIQGGMLVGGGVAAGKGIAKVQELRDKIQAEQRQGYTQDTSTEGVAELMARSKGFLTPEARATAPAEDFGLDEMGAAAPGEAPSATTDLGEMGAAAPGETPSAAADLGEMGAAAPGEVTSAGTDLGEMGAAAPGEVAPTAEAPTPVPTAEAPVVSAEREARIKELASKLEDITGATEEDAIKIATQRVEKEEAENVPTTVPSEPVGGPSAEGAGVAEQPAGVATAEGPTEVEPGGMVPAGLAPAGADVGEGPQFRPLTAEEQEAPAAKAPITVAETKTTRGDALTGASTKVKLSDGSEHEINRQDTNTTAGLPGWHDINLGIGYSYLGNTKAEAIEELIRRQERKAEAPAETSAETEAEAPVVNPPANEVVEQAKAAIAEIKKRGRPKLVLTTEQEVAKAAERKTSKAVNERTTRAAEKQTTLLERAVSSGNQTNRRAAYKELLKLRASGTGTDSVRKAIKATLEKHSNRFTPAELETLKREVADEKGVKTLPSIEGAASIAKADPKFSKFTNGVQAITHIAKTGTPFQKLVAQRIRSFVGNVNFVVLEKDSPVPDRLKTPRVAAEWAKARGMYVQNDATGERTVYLRGASFGSGHGVSNVVVLHELLHAATNQKLYLGLKALERGFSTTNAITQASNDITRIMKSAEARFNQLVAAGELPSEIRSLKEHGSIFTSPQEFLAYGMSDEAMQTFLLGAKGSEGGPSFFNRFVGAIRKAFNIGESENNAMMDLVLATDKLLSAQKSATMRMLEAGNKALAQRSLAEPKVSKAALTPEEEAAKLDRDASKAAKTTANSRAGEDLGKAVSIQAAVRNPVHVWRALSGVWDGLNDSARSRISNFFDLDAIARGPGERIPALQDVAKVMQQMSGMTQNILRSTSKIAEQTKRFYRAHPNARVAFEDLVHTTTLAKYDPAKVGNTARNEPLDKAFAALPEKGQQLYRDLRDYYKAMNELQVHLVTENLDRLDIPDADRKKLIGGIREVYERENRIEPYFPLMRHGDYILKIGKRGSSSYLSMRFDTKAERERAAQSYADLQGRDVKELEQDGHITKSEDVDGIELRRSVEASSELLKAGYAAIDAAPIGYAIDPTPVRAAMKDNLYQAYLASMPEGSTRKMFIHREGTAGFSSDVLRNLNSYGLKASKAYSKLKFGTSVRQALAAAERGLVGPEEKYRPFVTRAKEMVAEYLEPPQKTGIAKGAEQITDMVTKVSFIRNLTSWSSAMLQPADVVLKGTPVLVGNHGPKAITAILQRMKIWNQYGVVQKNADGTTTWRAPSIEFARGLTPEQRKAVRDMNAMYGVTTDTLANEIFSQVKKTGSKLDSKWVENSKDAANTLIMGGLMHHGERLSREVMFLTSYDLYRGEGLPHAEAVHSAVQEVTEAVGNYAAYGKPMVMRGAGGKLVTMYKFFPLITTKLLVSNFFRMLPLMNKEGKVAAATKFFGIMGTHLLAGGLTALPLFGVVMSLIGAAWAKWGRDPDAPAEMKDVDYITWWKSVYMDKVFGSTHIADVLKSGALNKLTGWDIAGRISLNDMWFRELPHSKNLTETAMNLGWVLAGAGASTALDIAKGVQLGINGEYQLGLEKILPASISKLMIAHRYATEGVEDSRGVKLLEQGKLPTSAIAGQALGFRPAKVVEAQERGFKASTAERVIVEEKNKIAKDIKDNFRKSTDLDKPADYQQRFEAKFEDSLEKMREFNGKHPEKAFAIDAVFELILSDAELKANLEANAGVKITPENVRLLGDTVDKAIEALESYDKKEAKP